MAAETVRLFLCGDVMTGRGIDQILPHASNPILYEPYIGDARAYLDLAEKKNGPIPRGVDSEYIWGDALEELERSSVDLRVLNLETAITAADTNWPGKEIHYRMHPKNAGALVAAHIDICALANNHVLDWGDSGLSETLLTLDKAGIAHAGAGIDSEQAATPAIVDLRDKRRVLLFSFGSGDSGIPRDWGATENSPGVNLLDFSEATASQIGNEVRRFQQPDDLLIASIHWGANWGYEIPFEQIAFAHRLIAEGFALVHGHSSHHPKAIEVFNGRLILYGCGDFLTDYEGISGYENFHSDIAVIYLVDLNRSGELVSARLVPMKMRRFQLKRVGAGDSKDLHDLLNDLGAPFGTSVRLESDNNLRLAWHQLP
ncbi:MAG TPA: CapA family protein [Chthoniobacterales bacterium]|nr:CapA family protein [Chthoniobacterales bacterium]